MVRITFQHELKKINKITGFMLLLLSAMEIGKQMLVIANERASVKT